MADLNLRRKQDIWENPRNITILVGATAALIGAIAGWTGYKIGSQPNPPAVIIQFPPSLAPQLISPPK